MLLVAPKDDLLITFPWHNQLANLALLADQRIVKDLITINSLKSTFITQILAVQFGGEVVSV